jgi:hypothetical protein
MSFGIRKGIFIPMPFIGKVSLIYFGNPYSPSTIRNLPNMMLLSIWKKEFTELELG